MATLNSDSGCIMANCPGCDGARSIFEWRSAEQKVFGAIRSFYYHQQPAGSIGYQLFRCTGCGRGALGIIKHANQHESYPNGDFDLLNFYPETKDYLHLPNSVPEGIKREFKEAEQSFNNDCFRAAAGLFRSVLDKTLRANGYDTRKNPNLKKQIDAAAEDGVITQARKKRAHDEVRVLGNDVLHDDWCEILKEDIVASRRYTQRILEDLYDDRETVLGYLREVGRKPLEDQCEKEN